MIIRLRVRDHDDYDPQWQPESPGRREGRTSVFKFNLKFPDSDFKFHRSGEPRAESCSEVFRLRVGVAAHPSPTRRSLPDSATGSASLSPSDRRVGVTVGPGPRLVLVLLQKFKLY